MKRSLQVAVSTSLLFFDSADALSASSRTTAASSRNVVQSIDVAAYKRTTEETRRRLETQFFDGEDDENYDENDREEIFFEVDSFQELQRSTGSEILDDTLQSQIDNASQFPDTFLDAYGSGGGDNTAVSYLEKVAMSSIPEQLPKPAVKALTKTKNKNANKKKKKKGLQDFASRVSREEEIELAKMIQNGVKLHKLKTDFEESEGRKISKTEWTKLAGFESSSELRHEVANYRRAKQLLVSANMGLVHAVVRTQINQFRRVGMSFEEVVQEGSLGLLRAAELFDPSRGLRFSTYATIWIKGTLSNTHLVEPIKLPQRERTKNNKITRAYQELMQTNGGDEEPSVEEVANYLDMTVADVIATKKRMTQAQQVLSLDYESNTQTRSGTDTSRLNTLETDKAFRADADLAERAHLQADVVAAMARNLDAREARLMRLRYGLSDGRQRTLHECAEAMGISYSRAQNIAKQCLQKMKDAAEAESLEEYLLTIA